MTIPAHLRYSADHEWLDESDGMTTVGLTELVVEAIGDIVYVQLPSVGDEVVAGDPCGAMESDKTATDLYSPASGRVVEVNAALRDKPGLVNDDPFGAGWLFRMVVTDWGSTLTSGQYEELAQLPLPKPC